MNEPAAVADEIFGFHVQQAIEKALKAWIVALSVECPRTHDIGVLLEVLSRSGCDVAALAGLVRWNLFAVQFRYSTYEGAGEALDRDAASGEAARRLDAVTALLRG